MHSQMPLSALPEGGAIVLEFKHYKPLKQKACGPSHARGAPSLRGGVSRCAGSAGR